MDCQWLHHGLGGEIGNMLILKKIIYLLFIIIILIEIIVFFITGWTDEKSLEIYMDKNITNQVRGDS